jgi:hypothetical protein
VLREFIGRCFWRLQRWVLTPTWPSPAATGIDRYSLFQGALRIAGALEVPAPAHDLALHLPGGERLSVRFHQAAPGLIRFDELIPIPAPAPELASAMLVASLEDGREIRQAGLGDAINDPAHLLTDQFRSMLQAAPPGQMLEIGARARSGNVRRDWLPAAWTYSGFDITPGPNVDVVGDAHALSRHYPADSFDAVMAFSVLEHLLMPWKFILELNRVLKPGAIGLFTTHQTWPLHDQPWDFWRFSDAAWTALLNPATGFEILAARMGEPAFIIPQRCSAATAFPEHPSAALASFVLFRKTGPTSLEWPVELSDILQTTYPQGQSPSPSPAGGRGPG